MVRLKNHEREYLLVLEDDGKEFDFCGRRIQCEVSPAPPEPWVSQQCFASLRGELSIEAKPNQGAYLEIYIPGVR